MAFLELVIKPDHRDRVPLYAARLYPTLTREVATLKAKLLAPQDLQSHVLNCLLYVKESKRLIRLIAMALVGVRVQVEKGSPEVHQTGLTEQRAET